MSAQRLRSATFGPAKGFARPRPAPRGPVTLHIERLVLDGLGLTPAQASRVQAAMEAELTRLVGRPSSSWQAGAMPALAAPGLRLSHPPRPAQLGRDIARSLYHSLRNLS